MVKRHIVGSLIPLLAACPLQVDIGDNPLSASGDTGASEETGAPTTGEPVPTVCGDGVVEGDEPCDDGNDEPNDGCDSACARTGVAHWEYAADELWVPGDITVAADGRIIAVGDDTVLALNQDGEVLWTRVLPDDIYLDSVAVDAAGRIYASGPNTWLVGLDPAGAPLWISGAKDDPDSLFRSEFAGLALADGALYSLASEYVIDGSVNISRLRRHDPATGDVLHETVIPSDTGTRGSAIAADDAQVVVVGFEHEPTGPESFSPHGLVAAYDHDGALLSRTVDPLVGWLFLSIASTGDGGFILGGRDWAKHVTVRRLDAAMNELWTRVDEAHDGWLNGVARGPGGELVLAGAYDIDDFMTPIVRRIAGNGAELWTSQYPSSHVWAIDEAVAVAAGSEFVAALGADRTEPGWYSVWIRCYASQ